MQPLLDLLSSFDPSNPNFRPTEIYNESWLIKLVVHQASKMEDLDFPIGFLPGSTWFSESLLPTAFKARCRGDTLAESRTNADCVIGHILIGEQGKADLELVEQPEQFTVIEAKINSPLAKGITKAPYYDQAARTVACMVETMAQGDLDPTEFEKLDFIVLAPETAIKDGKFSIYMTKDSIRSKVERRISKYESEYRQMLESWFDDYFEPTLEQVELHNISWEKAIGWIGKKSPEVADELSEFYDHCLEFN